MTDKPHDALFKAAFETPEHAAGLFQSLLPTAVSSAIDWTSIAREDASFIDPDLVDRHSDLLFSVPLADHPAYLYLLLEHQSSNDPEMPFRVLVYLVRIWERFRKQYPTSPLPIVLPAVISHAPGGWTAPKTFQDLFDPQPSRLPDLVPLIPNFSLVVEDLAHLSNQDIKAKTLALFPSLALWALRDARNAQQLLQNLGQWGAAFAEAAQTKHGIAALAQLMRYIALVTDDLHLEQFRATIRSQSPEAEVAAMTIAEQMRREGREEGRYEERSAVLRKLLSLKFGDIADEVRRMITSASAEDLERYIERVLTADTLDQIFD